jgi:hypothetical protein
MGLAVGVESSPRSVLTVGAEVTDEGDGAAVNSSQHARITPSLLGQHAPVKFKASQVGLFSHCASGCVGSRSQQSKKISSVVGQQKPVKFKATQTELVAHVELSTSALLGENVGNTVGEVVVATGVKVGPTTFTLTGAGVTGSGNGSPAIGGATNPVDGAIVGAGVGPTTFTLTGAGVTGSGNGNPAIGGATNSVDGAIVGAGVGPTTFTLTGAGVTGSGNGSPAIGGATNSVDGAIVGAGVGPTTFTLTGAGVAGSGNGNPAIGGATNPVDGAMVGAGVGSMTFTLTGAGVPGSGNGSPAIGTDPASIVGAIVGAETGAVVGSILIDVESCRKRDISSSACKSRFQARKLSCGSGPKTSSRARLAWASLGCCGTEAVGAIHFLSSSVASFDSRSWTWMMGEDAVRRRRFVRRIASSDSGISWACTDSESHESETNRIGSQSAVA